MNLTLPQEDTQQEKEEMTFLTKGYIFEVLTAVKLSLKEVWEDIRREKYKTIVLHNHLITIMIFHNIILYNV